MSSDVVEEQKAIKRNDGERDGELSEEEQEERSPDFEQKEQEKHWHDEVTRRPVSPKTRNEGAPCIIILADGTLQGSPEVLRMIAEKIEKMFVGTHDDEQAAKNIGNELSYTSDKVEGYFRGSSDESSEQDQQHLADEVIRFTNTISRDFVIEDLPDTQTLAPLFESALSGLFSVPVADQTPQQLVVTFIKLALFSMSVVRLCKQLQHQESAPLAQIALTVATVGNEMYKIANQRGLYRWIQDNGGWCGLCTRIHNYIVTIGQLIGRGMSDCDSNNAVSIPWPSNNTVILFGTLTVFVVSFAYFSYKYR